MISFDRLDARLLAMLERDARVGVVEMAAMVGVSRNTVQSRLRRLEASGLLRGYTVALDLSEGGFAVQAFLALEIEQRSLPAVVNDLAELPQVLQVHATTGREDLLVQVATATQAELQQLILQVTAIPGVTHSSTTLALTTPLPFRVGPLLDNATRESGWGRSTPSPDLT